MTPSKPMPLAEPAWLAEARHHVGLREIHGAPTAPTIKAWLQKLKAWWADDETPWCGTFCAAVMQNTGIELPKHWYRAKGWLDWGVPLEQPDVGCVVVFEREGGGHVGFVVGRDLNNNLQVLGGNQGDAVSIATFPRTRVVGYRWPRGELLMSAALPLLGGSAMSTREA